MITLGRGQVEQAQLLTELCLRAKRSNGYDDAFMAACHDELTVTAEQLRNYEWWVASDKEKSDAVCGCACLDVHADTQTGEVDALFIDPLWQRKGVGKLLWVKLRERAVQHKLVSLTLAADPNAVPFYEAMGWVIQGQTPSGSIAGRFLPRMVIDLRST